MEKKVKEIFERTLNNCIFYENQGNGKRLLNEIGVLRGVAYVMDEMGICSHNQLFVHFIDLQNKLHGDEFVLMNIQE